MDKKKIVFLKGGIKQNCMKFWPFSNSTHQGEMKYKLGVQGGKEKGSILTVQSVGG